MPEDSTIPAQASQTDPYFVAFLGRSPPEVKPFTGFARTAWHLSAGLTIGLGVWYLMWRWSESLNPDAMAFSMIVAGAETMAFLGTLLFFFNIWDEGDNPCTPSPETPGDVGLEDQSCILVDIFITTYDEDVDILALSVDAAKAVTSPPGVTATVHLLDDGNRPDMRALAEQKGIGYLERTDNRGYKAGNLANALFATEGDFVAICDADTQLFTNYLEDTLGYFRDPKVAWVQTPHWFYDIPEGMTYDAWLGQKFGHFARFAAPALKWLTGRNRVGVDPFLSNPAMFFDVIQRRRNRHGASFCCGAGSIHRREAIFSNALFEQGRRLAKTEKRLGFDCARTLLPRMDMQPFQYHVSEDIFTSLQQHAKGWKSVYHPQIVARMLSPWTMQAWAMQKLKYAGGTYDIMLKSGLIFRSGLPWQTRLHYMATFWSYLAALWLPILFLAPMASLMTGVAPVQAYSVEFFIHLIPLLLMNELAMSLGCKRHDIHAGRILSLATLNIQWRALIQVLKGDKPHFPPTPKNPVLSGGSRYVTPLIAVLGVVLVTAAYGIFAYTTGSEAHSGSLVLVNLFWLGVNSMALVRVALAAFWRPRLPDGSPLLISP